MTTLEEFISARKVRPHKDKRILCGDELLFLREEWVPFHDMDTEAKILNHPLFDIAFEKILVDYKPTQSTALISLCTSTRPYIFSRKWKKFVDEFGDSADMIVVSNGGIIPRNYWESYPYQNYDGHSTVSGTPLYLEKLEIRLWKFFTTHKYDRILANFRPNQRNTPVVIRVCDRLLAGGHIREYQIIPTEQDYADIKSMGFPAGKCFPDLDPVVIRK